MKGLYAKARAGEIPEFTGVSDPYEPPPAARDPDRDARSRLDGVGRPGHRLPRGRRADGAGAAGRSGGSTLVIDLHSHSTMSDGTDSPSVVVHAGRRGRAVGAGPHRPRHPRPRARRPAPLPVAYPLRLVPGCEISCELAGRAPGTMHLLVFFVDDVAGASCAYRLAELQAARQRAQRSDRGSAERAQRPDHGGGGSRRRAPGSRGPSCISRGS